MAHSMRTPERRSGVTWDYEYLERGSGPEYRCSKTPSPVVSRTSSVCASPEPGYKYTKTSAFPPGPGPSESPSPQASPAAIPAYDPGMKGSTSFLSPSSGPNDQKRAVASPEPPHLFSELIGKLDGLFGGVKLGQDKPGSFVRMSLASFCEPDACVTFTPRDAFIPERMNSASKLSSSYLAEGDIPKVPGPNQSPKDAYFVGIASPPGKTRKPEPSPVRLSRAVLRSPPSSPPQLALHSVLPMPTLNEDEITGTQVLMLVKRAQYLEQKYKYMERKPPKFASYSEKERYKHGLIAARDAWEQAEYEAKVASRRMKKRQAELSKSFDIQVSVSSPDLRRTSTT